MHRTLEVTVPPEQTDALMKEIAGTDGLLSLRVQRGISEHPKGDLITIQAINKRTLRILSLLEERGIGKSSSSSVSISGPNTAISPTAKKALGREKDLHGWEGMQVEVAKTSNGNLYTLVSMFIAGAIAAVAISTGALHVAVGAFVIAPGFQPIVRAPLDLVAGSPQWHRGIIDTLKGYASLILGAVLGALVVKTTSPPLLTGASAYFPVEPLVTYWTSYSVTGALVGITGGMAGAIMIATGRAVLTAGVVIALALVPTASMVGIAVAAGEFGTALSAFGRFAGEVGFVALGSLPVWLWLRAREQSRSSML